MGLTIIGEDAATFPAEFIAPIIETKATWSSGWEFDPELELVSCAAHASSSSLSSATVRRRYGDRKMAYESDFPATPASPRDLTGLWLRVSVMGPQGPLVQFVGVVSGRSANAEGTDTIPAGEEVFVAYGGLYLLQRMEIHQAVFLNADASTSTVGWIPAMNSRDRRNTLVGNAADAGGGLFLYGGTAIWNHLQYLIYLLEEFIQQTGGPTWTLGGQLEILDSLETTIQWGVSAKAADMLKELIPVKYGIDFCIRPTTDGFEIFVFALSDQDIGVSGVTMPRNPATVEVHKNRHVELFDTKIVETLDRRYDSINVVGKRIVVCGSLRGPSAGNGEASGGTSLVKRWTTALETEYKSPPGVDLNDPSAVDQARRNVRYRDVYQHLGAPDDWDLDGGVWAQRINFGNQLASGGEFQLQVRETLPYIPLKVGFDYSTWPPTDNTAGEVTPEHRPPMAFLLDEQRFVDARTLPEDPDDPFNLLKYVSADQVGFHVSHPFQDWGVIIDASPNHRLALRHWSASEFATSNMANEQLCFDYETAIATIAIESDHRVGIHYATPPDLSAGDGSSLMVHDDAAELWLLLPGTVVGVDPITGELKTTGESGRILRDDRPRLALVAAGLMARYVNERVRATLAWKGHQPWAPLIGQVLTTIVQGDIRQRVGAPITSVEWTMGKQPTTIIRTGYA